MLTQATIINNSGSLAKCQEMKQENACQEVGGAENVWEGDKRGTWQGDVVIVHRYNNVDRYETVRVSKNT